MEKFKLPPVSTLAGTTLTNFYRVFRHRKVDRPYWDRKWVTFLIVVIGTPFRWLENVMYYFRLKRFRMQEPPVFIIGHWRSGTTFLHNLMCQDPANGYITTYQSLFPHHLSSKWLFRTFMKWAMPKKRPADNVRLSVDFPQEDEFCTGNYNPYNFYYFFFFPAEYRELYRKYVRYQGVGPEVKKRWLADYNVLIKKALLNTHRKRIVIKNPVNTGRIATLLEAYPHARFIYIYRDPVTVYLSTRKFFIELFPTLNFQNYTEGFIDELILTNYQRLFTDYQSEKKLIPEGQLAEVQFEVFEEDPVNQLQQIYEQLGLSGFEAARPQLEAYVNKMRKYQKNRHTIAPSQLEKVESAWKDAFETFNYDPKEALEE